MKFEFAKRQGEISVDCMVLPNNSLHAGSFGTCAKMVELVANAKHPEKLERIYQNFLKTKLFELTHASTNDNFNNFTFKHLSLLSELSFYR